MSDQERLEMPREPKAKRAIIDKLRKSGRPMTWTLIKKEIPVIGGGYYCRLLRELQKENIIQHTAEGYQFVESASPYVDSITGAQPQPDSTR